jgi:hypothetical protein
MERVSSTDYADVKTNVCYLKHLFMNTHLLLPCEIIAAAYAMNCANGWIRSFAGFRCRAGRYRNGRPAASGSANTGALQIHDFEEAPRSTPDLLGIEGQRIISETPIYGRALEFRMEFLEGQIFYIAKLLLNEKHVGIWGPGTKPLLGDWGFDAFSPGWQPTLTVWLWLPAGMLRRIS